MLNIDMKVEGDILTIKIDMKKTFGQSTSGKSIKIASTEGNQDVPGGNGAKIGLNVYRKV